MSDLSAFEFVDIASSVINQNYKGDPLGLQSFLDSINLLKSFVTNDKLENMFLKFVLSKLEGSARDKIIGYPSNVDEIISILTSQIKHESSMIINSRIQAFIFDRVSLTIFSEKAEKLTESYHRALVMEGIPPTNALQMTIDKTVEMCRFSTQSNLVKMIMASSTFEDPKDAIATFIIETNTEIREKQLFLNNRFRKNECFINPKIQALQFSSESNFDIQPKIRDNHYVEDTSKFSKVNLPSFPVSSKDFNRNHTKLFINNQDIYRNNVPVMKCNDKYGEMVLKIYYNKKCLSTITFVNKKFILQLIPLELEKLADKHNFTEFQIDSNDVLFKMINPIEFRRTIHSRLLRIKVSIVHFPKQVLNNQEKLNLIKRYHINLNFSGHVSKNRILTKLRKQYYWKNMHIDIAKYLQNCQKCKILKYESNINKVPGIIPSNINNILNNKENISKDFAINTNFSEDDIKIKNSFEKPLSISTNDSIETLNSIKNLNIKKKKIKKKTNILLSGKVSISKESTLYSKSIDENDIKIKDSSNKPIIICTKDSITIIDSFKNLEKKAYSVQTS